MTETENKTWRFPVNKVGVLGLGPIGTTIAELLAKMGQAADLQKIVVFDPDERLLSACANDEVHRSTSIAHLVDNSDLVLLCLSSGGDVAKIARSHEGLLDCARQGQIIIDHSWSQPDLTHQLCMAFAKRGAAFLDAPISRSARTASALEFGQQALAISGDMPAIEAAMPVLRCFTRVVTPMGSAGAAQVVRQMSDLVAFQTFTALAEAMAAAKSFGIDGALMIKVLAQGYGDGAGVALQNYQGFLDANQALGQTKMTIGDAEQRLSDVIRLAESKKLSLAGASGTLALLKKASDRGLGGESLGGLATVIEPERPAWRQKSNAS